MHEVFGVRRLEPFANAIRAVASRRSGTSRSRFRALERARFIWRQRAAGSDTPPIAHYSGL